MVLPVQPIEVERILRRSRTYKARHSFTTLVDDDTAKRVTEISLAEDMSRSEALRRIIQCGLDHWEKHDGRCSS